VNQFQAVAPVLSVGFVVVLVLACTVTDLYNRKIPNCLTLPAVVIGLLIGALGGGWKGVFFSGTGIIVGFGLMFLFYYLGAMGAGDVKLMAAVGALLGYPAIVQVFFYTAISGGVIAMLVLLRNRLAKQAARNLFSLVVSFFLLRFSGLKAQAGEAQLTESVGSIPYGVAIGLGTTAYLCFGRIV